MTHTISYNKIKYMCNQEPRKEQIEHKHTKQENVPAYIAESASLWPRGKPTRLLLLSQNETSFFKALYHMSEIIILSFLKHNILYHN